MRQNLDERLTPLILYGFVLLLLYEVCLILRPFLGVLAWAGLLAIAAYPIYTRNIGRLGRGWSAALTTVGLGLTVVVPASVAAIVVLREVLAALETFASGNPRQALAPFGRIFSAWQQRISALSGVDIEQTGRDMVARASKLLISNIGVFAQDVLTLIVQVFLILIALFFLLRGGASLVRLIARLSPLPETYTWEIFERIRTLTTTSLLAIALLAVLQGSLGGILYAILGMPSPVVWGAAFMIASLIPGLGASLVWAPAALWVAARGEYSRAVLLALLSILIMGLSDNVLRPWLVSGKARLNAFASAVSIFGGLAAFGFIGVILGPVIVTVAIAVIDFYLQDKTEVEGASYPEQPPRAA